MGRSGTAYAAWLEQQSREFVAGIEHAALDPFRGYANAIRDELPDTVAVLDAFHVVRSTRSGAGSSRTPLGHRGHRDDPLYRIRGLLRRGSEHLNERQVAKLNTCLHAGDPGWKSPSPGTPTNGSARPTRPRTPPRADGWPRN